MAGRSRGRYLCPIDGGVVTLGRTGVRLDRPVRLVWVPGLLGIHRLDEPGEADARRLERVAGRVLGPGCVVSWWYDPDRGRPPGWREVAGLRLVDAGDDGGGAGWWVNRPLVYGRCSGCGALVADLPERSVGAAWTPRRAQVQRRRGRGGMPGVPGLRAAGPGGPLPRGGVAQGARRPRREGATGAAAPGARGNGSASGLAASVSCPAGELPRTPQHWHRMC